MYTLDNVKEEVYFKFRLAQLKGMETERLGQVHVSDVIKPCMRYVYYSKTSPRKSLSTEDMRPLFFGQAVHTITQVAKPEWHEITLAYNIATDKAVNLDKMKDTPLDDPVWWDIIIGTIDDVIEMPTGEYIITDKKTTGSIDYFSRATSRPSESHVDQINTYRLLLNKCKGIDAKHGAVIYISSTINKEKMDKPSVLPFKLKDIGETLEAIKTNQQIIKDAMLNDKVPKRTKCYLCDGMCPHASFCFSDER